MRGAAFALACSAWLASGCAFSMISDGELEPGALDALASRTTAATARSLPEGLETAVIPREEIPELLRELLVEDWSETALADYSASLVAVGLWPPERDLLEETLSVSGDEVAGLYAPQRRTLYVVSNVRIPLSMKLLSSLARRDIYREFVLAHELVHAHQHTSHPTLMEDYLRWQDQDDAATAVSATIEGDATRYGFAGAFPGQRLPDPTRMRDDIEQEMGSRASGALAEAPALIRLTLAFPYAHGYPLAYFEGGDLLDSPPASTEQILHGDRRRERFLAIDLTPLQSALPSGCRALGANTMGELQMSVLFRDLAPEVDSSAWNGWDGDRYLAVTCGDQPEFVWVTSWDSDDDAAEFEVAYAEISEAVAARAGLSAPPRALRSGREVIVVTGGLEHLVSAARSLPRRARVGSVEELASHFGR